MAPDGRAQALQPRDVPKHLSNLASRLIWRLHAWVDNEAATPGLTAPNGTALAFVTVYGPWEMAFSDGKPRQGIRSS